MIIVAILVVMALYAVSVFLVAKESSLKRAREGIMEEYRMNRLYLISHTYSVSDYYDRTEKFWLSLQEENDNREPYRITLWLIFDGLQLNEDGTTEWVSRKPVAKQQAGKPQPHNPLIAEQINQSGLQSASAQIFDLQSQIQACMCEEAQMRQTQHLINALNSPQFPIYLTYYGTSPYTPKYNLHYYGLSNSCYQNYTDK